MSGANERCLSKLKVQNQMFPADKTWHWGREPSFHFLACRPGGVRFMQGSNS
jgi:hypothetical protein